MLLIKQMQKTYFKTFLSSVKVPAVLSSHKNSEIYEWIFFNKNIINKIFNHSKNVFKVSKVRLFIVEN